MYEFFKLFNGYFQQVSTLCSEEHSAAFGFLRLR